MVWRSGLIAPPYKKLHHDRTIWIVKERDGGGCVRERSDDKDVRERINQICDLIKIQ